MSCSPCAATTLTPGTPAMGADTTPSGRIVRMVPVLSVTRKLPSGRKARDQGAFSRAVSVSTATWGEGLGGAGASLWPGNAGRGFGGLPVNRDWAWADGNTRVAT